ncbi:MAG TPA: alpha-amylase/4-alpha-glucanotransferase domain-containing protein, partial [Rhodocyclaceae bacterium]|nr:alpha-amylase/4-alpha-glucanotransferase domain-containing protein [Rhodocyclaceae bacterium]
YRLPFSPAEAAVAWLEHLAREGHRAAVYFDDIEKFGIWPETYHWVYEQGWLTKFIEGVLASKLIKTATYADFHAAQPTRGIVYLPTTSYIEMNEWTLPAPAARAYHALVEQEKQANRFENRKAFVRGGMWRNFFMRYPESNWMHKRMLDVSARFAALPEERRTPEMQEMLHRAQANDAYWHGLFGGLYLPHLRRAVWNNILALEAELHGVSPGLTLEKRDLDRDGNDELFLRSDDLLAVVRADGDAALVELSSLRLVHNFGDTLRRHDEGYHDKLHAEQGNHAQHEGIASAHDRIAFRHAINARDAEPDTRPRSMFDDCWYPAEGPPRPIHDYRQAGDTSFSTVLCAGNLVKTYRMDGERLVVRYRTEDAIGRVEIRLNIAMPSCDGYLGRYILENGDIPCGFGDHLELTAASRITLDDGVLGGSLTIAMSQALPLVARAHRTVSQSEAGFEKIMQAAELVFSWHLDGVPRELTFVLEAHKHRA